MQILQIAGSYPPLVSGVPEVVRQLSERLATRGHEVHVATGAVSGSPKTEVMNGVTVHRFDVKGNLVRGISGQTSEYLALVRSRRWDIMTSHCAQVWSTDLLFDAGLSGHIVFVAHGLSAYGNASYRFYYGLLAEWLRKGKTIVSLSRQGIEDGRFIKEHFLPAASIIPNGIDVREWSTPALGLRRAWGRESEAWLLNVSTHSPAKSHGVLFGLMRELRSSNHPVHLTQIGCGHPACKWGLGRVGVRGGCYYECIVRSQFDRSITAKLNVSRADTISAIKEADLMVLTSCWEASPLVILECMAAGTPFVSFDVGCVREHAGGCVVGSLSEMARTVKELIADGDLRHTLGQEGKRRVAERHDWELVVDAYEGLFNRLTTDKKTLEMGKS